MMRLRRLFPYAAIGLIVLFAAAFIHRYQPFSLTWYWVSTTWQKEDLQPHALWLPDYTAVIQAQPVHEVDDNLSGITWNDDTQTLFAVVNKPAQVVEITPQGTWVRSIDLENMQDTEDIAYLGQHQFALTGERANQLYIVTIDSETTRVAPQQTLTLPLSLRDDNHGAEALAWDSARTTLLVGQEKNPIRVVDISMDGQSLAPATTDISNWRTSGRNSLFINDLSGITVHASTANRLLLSDNSAMVVEYDAAGRIMSLLPLWRGFHGLKRHIPQAEGIALGTDDTLFIVSEPNLFYRFEKRVQASPNHHLDG